MAGISESNSEVSEVFNDLSIMASWDLVWKVTRNSLSPKAFSLSYSCGQS